MTSKLLSSSHRNKVTSFKKPETHVPLFLWVRQLQMSSPVLKRRNLSLKRRKSTTKVDENGLFEKECETEVDDDLPTTQWFVSPQKSLANYHPDDVLLCDSSSDLSLFYWFWLFTWLLIVCIKRFSFDDGISLVTVCMYVSNK